jgi:ABC-type polysaccharide/polyol phosphate transport system ATPase subunit
MIEVKNVSMRFYMSNDKINSLKEYVLQLATKKLKKKEFWALRDVSFDVEKGEVVGIIGRNGAGKSTILKVISGILTPTNGKVETHGNIVPMLELGSGFDYDLTGRENVFLNGAILGYSEEFLKEKYDEILEFSELGEFIEMPIRNYSSGMLMRLAFSIATVVQPEIMIVDEILAVGDANFQEKSKKRMLEMMSGGTTVLFVSHSIEQIEEMCNRVVWLEHGQMKMIGEAGDVCAAYQGRPGAKVEYSGLYVDATGDGFSEEHRLSHPIKMDGRPFRLNYQLEQPARHFRFDPVDLTPCLLRNFQVYLNGQPVEVELLSSNGTQVKQNWYFNGEDSQIEFSLPEPVTELEVRARLLELQVEE